MNVFTYFGSLPGTYFNSCWPTSDSAFDVLVHSVSDGLNIIGSAACFLGGAGLSLANAWDETLTTTYFGSVTVTGEAEGDLQLRALNYALNQTIPANYYNELHDGECYNLHDYFTPNQLRMTSGLVTLTGAVFRFVSTNLTHWKQEKTDRQRFKAKHEVDLPHPTREELLYLNSSSFSRSVLYTSLGSTAAGAFINYSGIVGTLKEFTFPANASDYVNTTHYQGAVHSTIFPLDYLLNKRLMLELYGQELELHEVITIQAEADVKYGGGLFFQSKAEPNFPIVAPTMVSIFSYYASTFFANKANKLRDDRIFGSNQAPIALPELATP